MSLSLSSFSLVTHSACATDPTCTLWVNKDPVLYCVCVCACVYMYVCLCACVQHKQHSAKEEGSHKTKGVSEVCLLQLLRKPALCFFSSPTSLLCFCPRSALFKSRQESPETLSKHISVNMTENNYTMSPLGGSFINHSQDEQSVNSYVLVG